MNENENPIDEDFDFPEGVLDQISECSPDGFILFIIGESGVEMFSKHDNEVIESGLKTKALKILNSLEAIESNEIAQQLFHQKYGPPPIQDNDDGEK